MVAICESLNTLELKHAYEFPSTILCNHAYTLGGMNTRAERIAHAIKESGHSPAEIAKQVGCSTPAVYQWMSGATKDLKNELLFALADFVGFEARWLATGEGPERLARDRKVAALVELYNRSDERGKAMIFRAAELESSYSVSGDALPQRPRVINGQ